MRRSFAIASLISALSTSVFVGEARADDAAVAEAQQRFKEGLDFADQGKYEEARLKFVQAASVIKTSAVLFNLARTEQLTGHDVEASEHFKGFLRVSATDARVTDAMRDKARQNIADLAKTVAQIEIDAPATARLTIDGKPLDETPKEPVAVTPGKHTVEATTQGRVKSVTVDATLGGIVKVKIEMDPDVGTPPPAEEPMPPAKWIVPTALGVAGLAALGVGIGFGLKSGSAKTSENDFRATHPGACVDASSALCGDLHAKQSDVNSAGTISVVGYVASGALLAGAAVTWFVWPKKSTSASRVVVSPSAQGATIHFGTTF